MIFISKLNQSSTRFFNGARNGIIKSVIEKIKSDFIIYVTVHTKRELKIVKKKYEKYKNIKCFKLDFLNDEDIIKVDKIHIDILINNAATMESGSLIEIPFKNIRKNFEVNFFSTIKLTRRVIIKNPKVKIITISLAGKYPMPFSGIYSASKAAITKAFKALNAELKLGKSKNSHNRTRTIRNRIQRIWV